MPWTDTKPTTPDEPGEPGVTEEYVNGKISEAEQRLQDLIEEAAGNGQDEGWWQQMYNKYKDPSVPGAGLTIDDVNGAIDVWAKSQDGKTLILQAFDAENATWKNLVEQEIEGWISGSQIKQTVDSISFLVGKFNEDGTPKDTGKWADFIIGLKKNVDGEDVSFVDIVADEITLDGSVITPELIASKINSENITITSKLTATNADITGKITATSGEITNCNITNCTVSGDLQYGRIIGAVQNNINQSSEISNNVALAIITGRNITVRFPSQPVEGQTLYVKHIRPSSDGRS